MIIAPAGISLDFSVKAFILTIFVTFAFAGTIIFAAFKLNFLAIDNGLFYYSPYRLIRVYGKIVNPAEIANEQRILAGFEAFAHLGQKSTDNFKQEARDAVIRQKIVSHEADLKGLTVSASEIQNALTKQPNNILSDNHWTQADLKNQIYYQLLENKLRSTVEGNIIVSEIVFRAQKDNFDQTVGLAEIAKQKLQAQKDFKSVIKDLLIYPIYPIQVNISYTIDINQPSPFTDQSPTTLSSLQGLKDGEAIILTNKTNLSIVLGFAKSQNKGVNYDTWYEEIKNRAVQS